MILETRDKQFPRWQEPQFSLRQVLAEASLSFIPDMRTMRMQKRHLRSVRVMHSLWQVREGLGWWVSTFWWHTEAALPKDTGCARCSGASQAMVWMGVRRHSMCRQIWEVVETLGDLGIGTQWAISDLTTVTPKSVTITNLKPNHPWESHFALVGPNRVQTLGYKTIPESCDSAQGPTRYNSFKTGTPL